jgi:hypothetical protein
MIRFKKQSTTHWQNNMHDDKKLFKWLAFLIALPLALAVFGGDRFRYPCQDPANWDKPMCQKPACDVTRSCPEHIFKGQKDPRTLTDEPKTALASAPTKGVACGK